MNVMWNTVNFGLALPGYLKAKKNAGDWDAAEMERQQRKTQSIFLINSAVDIGYIATGMYLRGKLKTAPMNLICSGIRGQYGASGVVFICL